MHNHCMFILLKAYKKDLFPTFYKRLKSAEAYCYITSVFSSKIKEVCLANAPRAASSLLYPDMQSYSTFRCQKMLN